MSGTAADLTIRPLAPGDEAAWRPLWTAYLDFYDTAVAEEVYRTTFARLTGDARYDPRGLLALDAGRPVGLAHYILHRHGWKIADVCYLQDLYAIPESRGRGVGRALIEAVYAAADAAGAPDVYWLTQGDNTVARRLYDRIGRLTPFVRYDRA